MNKDSDILDIALKETDKISNEFVRKNEIKITHSKDHNTEQHINEEGSDTYRHIIFGNTGKSIDMMYKRTEYVKFVSKISQCVSVASDNEITYYRSFILNEDKFPGILSNDKIMNLFKNALVTAYSISVDSNNNPTSISNIPYFSYEFKKDSFSQDTVEFTFLSGLKNFGDNDYVAFVFNFCNINLLDFMDDSEVIRVDSALVNAVDSNPGGVFGSNALNII